MLQVVVGIALAAAWWRDHALLMSRITDQQHELRAASMRVEILKAELQGYRWQFDQYRAGRKESNRDLDLEAALEKLRQAP
jgi:hypothetical protein